MLIIMIVMVTIMNLMVNMVGLVWFYEEVVVGFVLCSFCASFFFHCIFLHCIYCVCTPKSKALGLYIFIKSLGLYALNGNGKKGCNKALGKGAKKTEKVWSFAKPPSGLVFFSEKKLAHNYFLQKEFHILSHSKIFIFASVISVYICPK